MSVLADIRVIEIANERIAFAGKLLADMGADVILIGAARRRSQPRLSAVSGRHARPQPQPVFLVLSHQQARHYP